MTNSDFNNKPNPKRPNRRMPPKKDPKQVNNNWLVWVILGFIALIMLGQTESMTSTSTAKKLTYSEFYSILLSNKETGDITKLELVESAENTLLGTLSDGTSFKLNIPNKDEAILNLIRENVTNFSVVPPQTFWSQMFFSFMPIIIFLFFIWFISHRGSQMGNKIWSFGKSKAKISNKNKDQVTFKDVAGVDEAKE
ncbi:MAG: hypothetical protein KKD07_00910, partial [Candidatus Omnitrophica bacterium]|nr:hypothetical protein [Candidatus Omnitrophota bacterium]